MYIKGKQKRFYYLKNEIYIEKQLKHLMHSKQNRDQVAQAKFEIWAVEVGIGVNKAVLEPRVSPAFAITYFCIHCNIRFDPIPVKVICAIYPRIIMSKSHELKVIDP